MNRRSLLGDVTVRWPLRNQVLLPISILVLAALAAVSALSANLSVQQTRRRIERELAKVAETLQSSTFPKKDVVMRQMSALAGADFILTDRQGDLLASSTEQQQILTLATASKVTTGSKIELDEVVASGDSKYYYAAIDLSRSRELPRPAVLHVVYPRESYLQAAREVATPHILVAAIAFVLVVGLSLGIASRVTRPLRKLKEQVNRIADGNFKLLDVPPRNDEIADLSRSVNQMADRLARYESEIRRNEQLRTLGQLGGGIAHQMRNSVTGCRMAIELHKRECTDEGGESLTVAVRQLELMERFLRRFLSLGRESSRPYTAVDLPTVVESVVGLVQPTASHLGVALAASDDHEGTTAWGDADALEQLLVNLVLNAIEAASQIDPSEAVSSLKPRTTSEGPAATVRRAVVRISLRRTPSHVELEVRDTGPGPPAEVREKLFDPFVTQRPDGTGLGLAVAHEVAMNHDGAITWRRDGDETCFTVRLPVAPDEMQD